MDVILKTSNLITLLKHIKLEVYLHDGIYSIAYELYKDFNIKLIDRNSGLKNRYDNKDNIYKEIIIKNY